ncbi:MAG TPA: acyl-CoA dehydrogenase family protein [Chloroflexota bacterium]|jgi:alkylation response protein AidB-like acyl-CoA dehydrogenase
MLTSTARASEVFATIRELGPLIRSHQRESERLGCIAAPVMDAFFERDLFRLLLSPEFGGAGLDLVAAMQVVEEVAYYDGSTGWVFGIGIGGLARAGFLPSEQARLLAMAPRAYVAGTLPPLGRATVVPGGYLVSGRWPFASGIHHATWIAAGCVVHDGAQPRTTADGLPDVVYVYLPTTDVTILDTWHVGGMRGTGSTEYTVDALFVPAERTSAPAERREADHPPLLKVLDVTTGSAFGFVAMGIARATIDGVLELAATQSRPRADRDGLRDRPSAHYEVAKAQAMLEAARLSYLDGLTALCETADRHEPLTLPLRARLRRAQVHAGETAVEVVDQMYRTAGSAALFEAAPFERSLRDVHAIQAQVWYQRSALEDAGRVAFGLAPRRRTF